MVEDAREEIADAIGAERAEVVFTSGATEANALGVIGAARHTGRPAVLISQVEHDSVAKLADAAPDLQWRHIPVDSEGVSIVPSSLGDDIALASMSLVCAETGVIQPVESLVAASGDTLIHTDAAQAIGHLPVSFSALGVDLLTLGGHKIGAPVGTGALIVRRGVEIDSDRPGGGQERKRRSGTVDAAGAVALAAALNATVEELDAVIERHQALKDRLVAGLPPGVHVTSQAPSSPGMVHLSLPTSSPEVLLMAFDQAGVMVSAGSACHAGVTRPSEILLNMGRDTAGALGVLRVSFGADTDASDIDAFLEALPGALAAAQRMDKHFKERA